MCEIQPEGDFLSPPQWSFLTSLGERKGKVQAGATFLSSCHVSPTFWEWGGLIRALEKPCSCHDWDVLFGVQLLV